MAKHPWAFRWASMNSKGWAQRGPFAPWVGQKGHFMKFIISSILATYNKDKGTIFRYFSECGVLLPIAMILIVEDLRRSHLENNPVRINKSISLPFTFKYVCMSVCLFV